MTDSAIQNLSESLDLIQSTIEAILKNEAEFQTLVAKEIAKVEAPEEYIRSYEKNRTMVKLSLIMAGKSEGVSNTGEVFSETGLNFSAGGTVAGLPVSQSYVNHMGAWAYTIKSPVIKDGQEIASLYVEYIYDSLDNSLPDGFYNKQATLYIMDAGKLAEHGIAVQHPAQLGVGGDVGLNENRTFFRVQAAGDVLGHLGQHPAAQLGRLLAHGDGVQVGHEEVAVKFLDHLRPAADRP